jgi:Uma2 family endonuclease
MSTKKKPITYEFSEENETIAGEPFLEYPVLNLDPAKRYTFADYLTWMDDKFRELIDGFIHLMCYPTELHARISSSLHYFTTAFARKRKGKCRIYHAPFAVRLPIDGATDDDKIYNVFLPDICVICDLSKIDEKGCIGAPDLVVEVLSPSTAKNDWNKKFKLYEKSGVREYWIIDPKKKTLHLFLLQSDGKYDAGTVYQSNQKAPMHIFEGLVINLRELFEE